MLTEEPAGAADDDYSDDDNFGGDVDQELFGNGKVAVSRSKKKAVLALSANSGIHWNSTLKICGLKVCPIHFAIEKREFSARPRQDFIVPDDRKKCQKTLELFSGRESGRSWIV